MPRALPLTMRHFPAQKLLITPEILDSICNICDQIGDLGTVLKVGFTLSYYGFLRQNNIKTECCVYTHGSSSLDL